MDTERERLPSGHVTFVFTDIEGSTQMLRRLGDEYAVVVERHDAILADAVSASGGVVVGHAGDSMFAAFGDSGAALRACDAALTAIDEAEWPVDGRPRVRIGLHVGLARPRHGDYVALAVNQAARVMSAAHGEQILVTEAVVDRLDDAQRASVTSIQHYRLRDFDEPPLLYQHVGWMVRGDAPVRATPTRGHNLVVPAAAFFDRERELAETSERLAPGALVTLTGPGGVGKSRLVTDVGIHVVSRWPDGVWAVDLADLDDADLVVERLAEAVAVPRREADRRLDDVVERLRDRRAVVIYDGIERHVDTCAEIVATIAQECPGVAQLATGREPLRLPGEHRIGVAPLPVAAADEADPERIRRAEATALFLDRAGTIRPELRFDDDDLRSVAMICAHLDGLPLAIEIAAARVDVMTVEDIVDGLDDQFRLLRSRDRTLPERQRTMQGLLDWSSRLLAEAERTALRRLAIFAGGFGLDAARVAIADDRIDAADVPELVWALVESSLVVADETRHPTTYRQLETVRQYGRRLLDEHDETTPVALRVGRWLDTEVGPNHVVDRDWIDTMHVAQSNVRSVIPLVATESPELAQRLACSLGRYHEATHAWRPGIEELTRLVGRLTEPTPARVALLTALADLQSQTAALDDARRLVGEAAALQVAVGVPMWDDAGLERTRGDVALRSGDAGHAEEIALDALDQQLTDRGRARMWNLLGIARIFRGDDRGAYDAFRHELDLYLELGIEGKVASAHGNLAEAALRNGEPAVAAEHQSQCLDLAMVLGQPVMLAYSNIVAAHLAAGRGEWATAVTLIANARAALDEIGQALYESDERSSVELSEAAQAHLGKTEMEAARSRGLALDPVDAATIAMNVLHATRNG